MWYTCGFCDAPLKEDMLIPDERDSVIIYRCPSCKGFIKERRNVLEDAFLSTIV